MTATTLIYGRPYSEGENNRLRALVDEGLSHSAIAAQMRRTTSSVRNQCRKLGINTRRNLWTTEERARLVELIRADYRLADCAQIMGRSYAAVQSMSKRLNVPRSRAFVLRAVANSHAARARRD